MSDAVDALLLDEVVRLTTDLAALRAKVRALADEIVTRSDRADELRWDPYNEGARDAYDFAESQLREAIGE